MKTRTGILLAATLFLSSSVAWPLACVQTAEPTTVSRVFVLVRHAEKCLAHGDDPQLSPQGEARSLALARMLSDVPLEAIYSTPFQRTRLTAQPTASRHAIEITETPVGPDFLPEFAERLRSAKEKYSLVSGHSNTTPALANLLAGTRLDDLPDETYDLMYIVTLGAHGETSVLPLRYGAESGTEPGC